MSVADGRSGVLAFGLSILIFAFWAALGYAVLTLLHRHNNSALQNALMAPAMGMAATLLPVFWLNRAGIPVGLLAIPITVLLLAGAVATFWFFCPKFPWRDYLPFGVIFLLALLLTGWPLLQFGFDWVSYANPDMTTYYVLSAQRLHDFGFYQLPPGLSEGLSYAVLPWQLHSIGHRVGIDLLLAWAVGITKLMPTQAFMPLILAFHLVLVSSVGALVQPNGNSRKIAILSCGLLSASAVNALGTLYQLAAQVCGLALLVVCTVLLLQPLRINNKSFLLQFCSLIAIVVAGLLVSYPEIVPFLGLAIILYLGIGIIQKKLSLKEYVSFLGVIFLLVLVGLNTYLWDIIRFFSFATSEKVSASIDPEELLFPFFLIPSGLANFWGFLPITSQISDPWLSLTICISGLLFVLVSIATLWLLQTGQPSIIMTAVMIPIGLVLFWRRNDFGIFKLAMFMQPFILTTLVVAASYKIRRQLFLLMLLLFFCLSNLAIQFNYVSISRGLDGVGAVEIPNASSSHLYREMSKAVSDSPSEHLLFDSSNVSITGLLLLYARNKTATSMNLAVSMAPLLVKDTQFYDFSLHDPQNSSRTNVFVEDKMMDKLEEKIIEQDDALLISDTARQGLFNRLRLRDQSGNLVSNPYKEVFNHLVFIPSQLGKHFFFGFNRTKYNRNSSRREASFFQMEPDFFFPGSTIAAIGRHQLFKVLNPSSQGRVELNLTASLKSDGQNLLPPAAAIGDSRVQLPIIGRGSARVFSPLISPQSIDGKSYLAVDMGVDSQTFPDRKSGLMKLYGLDIKRDNRRIVGYGRDFSFVSSQEYEALTAPQSISKFPTDLANLNLEYSGLYEDGWLSESAFFGLTQPQSSSKLSFRGVLPAFAGSVPSTKLNVLIDGKEIDQRILQPGEFNLTFDVPQGENRRRVDIRFSKLQNLPSPDNRPVAVKLTFLGFTDEKN